jgi:hypothetical protein
LATQVKNKAIAASNKSLLAGFDTNIDAEKAGLADYRTDLAANADKFRTGNLQEQSAIGQFYTGEMAQKLAALRGQRETAVNAAADVGVKQALANVDRSRLGGEGGGSSYNNRLAIGATTPIRVQAALDTANQSRADLGYLTQNQLGLTGQRLGLINQAAGYGLIPTQTTQALQARDIQNLQGITNVDTADTFYGLKQNRSPWANAADALDSGILNAASIYGSVGGGGMNRGGPVHGPGTAHSDSIPINVSDGEFIVPASSVRLPGVLPMLQRIRAAGLASEAHSNALSDHIRMNRAGGWQEHNPGYDLGGYVTGLYDALLGHNNRRPMPEMQREDVSPLEGGFSMSPGGGGMYRRGGIVNVDAMVVPGLYADGGMVRRRGYDVGGLAGGMAGAGAGAGVGSDWSGGGGGGKGGGGGGGGLAAEAQYLLEREQGYLTPSWRSGTMIPGAGGQLEHEPIAPMPASTNRTMDYAMPLSGGAESFAKLYGPQAVPSNFNELPPDQQGVYVNSYRRAREMEADFPGGKNPYE